LAAPQLLAAASGPGGCERGEPGPGITIRSGSVITLRPPAEPSPV